MSRTINTDIETESMEIDESNKFNNRKRKHKHTFTEVSEQDKKRLEFLKDTYICNLIDIAIAFESESEIELNSTNGNDIISEIKLLFLNKLDNNDIITKVKTEEIVKTTVNDEHYEYKTSIKIIYPVRSELFNSIIIPSIEIFEDNISDCLFDKYKDQFEFSMTKICDFTTYRSTITLDLVLQELI